MWFIVDKAKARDFCLGMTDTWVSEDLSNSQSFRLNRGNVWGFFF